MLGGAPHGLRRGVPLGVSISLKNELCNERAKQHLEYIAKALDNAHMIMLEVILCIEKEVNLYASAFERREDWLYTGR